MSSASWTARETMDRQMKRAIKLRHQGLTSPAIARLIGISTKAQKERFVRHDRRTNGADRPTDKRRTISDEKRDQAVAMLEQGKTLRGVAAAVRISFSGVQRLKDEAVGVAPARKPKARKAAKARPAAVEPRDPVWTKARRLAAERRLKRRHCLDHIAADLCELPGPPVLPRDVVAFQRELRG